VKRSSVSDERQATAKTVKGGNKSLVMSLAKACRVLEIFDSQEPELNLSEIAKRADLDAGTAHRFVRTLVSLGYLQQADGAKRYRLGLKVIDLGFNAVSRMDVHFLSSPILRSLVGGVIEAASVGILSGAEIIYIGRVQAGLNPLGVSRGIGSRIPAYCSAIGQAILAFLPQDRRLQILKSDRRPKFTPQTLVTVAEIEERLAQVREQGYALCDQELIPGVRALAAPITDRNGYPHASLSVGASSFPFTVEEFVAYSAPRVVEGARQLSVALSTDVTIAPARQ